MNLVKDLLATLISFKSITPHDAGCQDFMIDFLQKLKFDCQRFDNPPVSNFFARFGDQKPLFVFAGHTDVVPIGDESKWDTKPFELQERNGMLYGRGVADMKGSLACMLLAAARFIKASPHFKGSLGFLITSGEEGDEFHLGTPYVMEQLHRQGIKPDFCVVGEPSSHEKVGDVIKIGRRGSLTAKLDLHGKQGHVAYPHLAENPIHQLSPALFELVSKEWDKGNDHFPPTSMQVTSIKAGGQASNIIPGELQLQLNFRYSTEQSDAMLKQAVDDCFNRHQLKPVIHWRLNGEPFLTAKGQLLDQCITAIQKHTGQKPELSTSGGTSDGRFIAPYGVEVLELGPVNATIHQVNECVSLDDLNVLTDIYYTLCERLCT
jgi:succinyl-diaminopimelate desuccinylase